MTVDVLAVLVVVTSGVVAGVLFGFAVSVLPAFAVMPPDRFVYSTKLIGRNWDPMMPIIVITSTVVDILLAIFAPAGTLPLFVVAAVLLVGVSVVSHWCNVPINRQVKKVDPENMPTDWSDPRPLWRQFHYLRTTLAIIAVALNAIALALL